MADETLDLRADMQAAADEHFRTALLSHILRREGDEPLVLTAPTARLLADRAAALEARVAEAEVNDKRYRVLQTRHFEHCPGDAVTLFSGSQYEHSAVDLDALADYLRALGVPVEELPERVAGEKPEGSEA